MSTITDQAANAFRNYTVAGLPASGVHEPSKSDIRDLFGVIDTSLSSILLAIAAAFPSLTVRTTQASLFGYLTPAAGGLAFVYADPDPVKNDFYVKIGATGTGSWAKMNITLPSSVLVDIDALQAMTIDGDGLATVTGSTSAGFEVSVVAATEAQALAGTSNAVVVTPLGLQAVRDAIESALTDAIDLKANQTDLDAEEEARVAAVSAEALTRARATNDRSFKGNTVHHRPRRDIRGYVYDATAGYTYTAWAVGFNPSRTIPQLASVSFWLANLKVAKSIRIEIWQRPLATGNGAGTGPGESGDRYDGFYVYNTSDVVKDDPRITQAARVDFPFRGDELPSYGPEDIVFFKISAFTGINGTGSVANLSMAQGVTNTDAQWSRGYIYNPTGFGIPSPECIAFKVGEAVAANREILDQPRSSEVVPVGDLVNVWPTTPENPTVLIPETRIARAYGEIVIPKQLVGFALPTPVNTSFVMTLQYNIGIAMPHQFVRNVVVKRQSDNFVLAKDVNYRLNDQWSEITGLNPGSTLCTVEYTGDPTRYDLVYADPVTGAVGVQPGTARGCDPMEYLPTCPAGKIPLYMAWVTVNHGTELIPIHLFRNFARIGKEGEHANWIDHNRRCMPRLFSKLRQGLDITWAGYGDSITEMGGGAPWGTPDGQYRDNINYLNVGRIGYDTIMALPRYNHGDPLGANHVHVGRNYYVKAAIEAAWGVTVTYKNWGLGGSTSSSASEFGVKGALDPDRLAALIASAPDAVGVGNGMNDLSFLQNGGSIDTYGNTRTLIQELRDAGIEPLIYGLPLIPPGGLFSRTDLWGYINDQLVQAALDENAAYVPLHLIANPDNMGAMAMSRRNVGGAGLNHPGIYEERMYGLFAALTFQ